MTFSKSLVTGGAGFIGSHLVQRLLQEGIEVYVLDNLSTGVRKNVSQEAIFFEGDISDQQLVAKILEQEVDIIFHLAAKVTVRGSSDNFYADAETNLMGTLNILRACINTNVRKFVFSSSMAVYGDSPSPIPIDERFNTEPRSPYGVSKLAAEFYVRNICESTNISYAILRFFNTYGPKQTFTPYVGVITIFLTRLLSGQSVTIFGDGQQCRDFIYVEDVIQGLIKAMESANDRGTYNLGTGEGTTVNYILETLSARLDVEPATHYVPRNPEELINSIACIDQAANILGYAPKYTFPDRVDEVIDHIRRGLLT